MDQLESGEYQNLLKNLLHNRGIKEADFAIFLEPDYERDVHPAELLDDIEKASQRIIRAIKEDQRIAVYSDYDTDGIPAAVMWQDFFRWIGYDNFRIYIPHRHKEGFGLNKDAIQSLIEDNIDLIITADCGIRAHQEVAEAKEAGIDVIITDHHLPAQDEQGEDDLPPVYAIVNPKKQACQYPFPDLCGAAVAFKLIQMVMKAGNKSGEWDIPDAYTKWLLDMVGIATVSDMVPLVGENRTLAHYGLKVLRQTRRPGLKELLRSRRVKQQYLNEEDIGFTIGPRINAASRMGSPQTALEMLSARSLAVGKERVKELERINRQRKGAVAAITKELRKRLAKRDIDGVVVTGDPKWRPSLLGLAANKLVDNFGCPAFLWGEAGDGNLKGSCRAPAGYDVTQLMGALPEGLLLDFGGHAASGGFTVSRTAVHKLEPALREVVDDIGEAEQSDLLVEADLHMDDVSDDLWQVLSTLAPFGIGNDKPLFRFRDVPVGSVTRFGKGDEHLKLLLGKSDGTVVEAVAFFADEELEPSDERVDILAHVEKSYFNGTNLRLRLVRVS